MKRLCVFAASLVVIAAGLGASAAAAGPSASDLFRGGVLRQLVLSPSGALLASVVGKYGRESVLVRRREGNQWVLAFKRFGAIRRVAWIDDQHVLVLMGKWNEPTYSVISVSLKDGEPVTRAERIWVRGQLIDRLPSMGEEVLWSIEGPTETAVYRLGISALLAEKGRNLEDPGRYERVASLEDDVVSWVTDRHGTVRAALRIEGGSKRSELWYRPPSDAGWSLLAEADDPEEIAFPLGVAENDRDLIVASRAESDTLALFELSSQTGTLGRELFAHPEADVTSVIYDYSGALVMGAVYEQDGLEEFHYFDSFYDRYQRSLERILPGVVVGIASVSADRRYFVVVATSPRDPGTYYVLDTKLNTAKEAGRVAPWLDPEDLVDVEALRVSAADGTPLEVFFALPKPGSSKPPLVVLPHGGPIGYRDSRSFDPLVQFLAAGGIAVVQVNYRGSSGRGRSFLDAGKQQWGRGIEDDIETAIDELVKRGLVDGDRVCIAGGSYGGYSALISVIRRPDRFRCAASINGPTDLPFAYESYFRHWKEGREYFAEFIGDPEGDHEKLIALSPAYRAAEVRVPVLLMHSTDDERVDVDHLYRMQTMLELFGKPHEVYLFKGGRHVLKRTEWTDFASRLRIFLTRHLHPS